MNEIVLNMRYSSGYSSKDMIYCEYCERFSFINGEIVGVSSSFAYSHLFKMENTQMIYLENIVVLGNKFDNSFKEIEYLYVDCVSNGEATIQNVYLSDYYTTMLIYMRNSQDCGFYFNNISSYIVYGDKMWYSEYIQDTTINMSLITMNGYDETITSSIVYYKYNWRTSIISKLYFQ